LYRDKNGLKNDIYYFLFYIIDMKKQGNVLVNNIEELLIKEYYIKYLPENSEILKTPPNTIYDREILNIYSNIYSR
jgi:hypothetical protein